MGWLSSIGDAITDAADAVGDAVSDAAEATYDTVASSSVGDAVAWVGRGVDTATFGLASDAMNAADDYVFDTVDYVTGGAINVDFDDGQLSVGAGFEGLAQVGASVGEAGVSANGEMIVGGSFDVSMTDAGFSASGSAGIDWGPLPYAEGHVILRPDGQVSINGHVQGTIPTPYGLLSGEVSGGFVNTTDGWGAFVDADGTLRMPTGTTLRAGVGLAYEETDDGSHLSAGIEGSVSYQGMATVGGSLGYERIEQDGDVVQAVHAEGEVDVLGVGRASAEADYVHAEVDGVTRSDWSGDASYDGPELGDMTDLAQRAIAAEVGGGAEDVLAASDVADIVPVDDFDAAIQSADSVEESLDGLMQDLA